MPLSGIPSFRSVKIWISARSLCIFRVNPTTIPVSNRPWFRFEGDRHSTGGSTSIPNYFRPKIKFKSIIFNFEATWLLLRVIIMFLLPVPTGPHLTCRARSKCKLNSFFLKCEYMKGVHKGSTAYGYNPLLADLISSRFILSILSLCMTIVNFAGYLNRISLILNVQSIILSKSSSLMFLCSFIRVIPDPKIGTETFFWA